MKTSLPLALIILILATLSTPASEAPPVTPKIKIVCDVYELPESVASALLQPSARPRQAGRLRAAVESQVKDGAARLSHQMTVVLRDGLHEEARDNGASCSVEAMRSATGETLNLVVQFRNGKGSLTTSLRAANQSTFLLGTLDAVDRTELVFLRCEEFFTPPTVTGATSNAPNPAASEAFAAITKILAPLQSVEFTGRYHFQETDISRAQWREARITGTPAEKAVVDLHFKGRGQNYYYTQRMDLTGGSRPPIEEREAAYDGRTYEVFEPAVKTIFVSGGDAFGRHLRLGQYSPLQMFGFLLPEIPGDEATLRWDTLKDPAAWSRSLSRTQDRGTEIFNGKPCLVARITGGVHKLFDVPCTYTVYFSREDNLFPIAWRANDLQGRLLEDYQVDEFGTVNTSAGPFPFPKRATSHVYTKAKYPAGEPSVIFQHQTLSLSFNALAETKTFSIDRTKATQIVDQDRNIATRLPSSASP